MDVFDLVAKLTLDKTSYEEGLNESKTEAGKVGKGIGGALKTAAKVGAVAITAVTTATVAMGGAVVKATKETAAYGDNIDKMSQKLGMSATEYQEWDAIMQHCGTSIDSMQSSMKTLATAAETGNEAFEKLGMTQEEVSTMSQSELFSATITALQNVEDGTERTYLAGKLLGRGATELGALLNTSAEDTEAMRQRVHELGGVMSDEAVKASAHFKDSLQDMQTAYKGISRGLTSKFLPSITTVMNGLSQIFSGDKKAGLGMIKQGVDNLLETINESAPEFIEAGLGILEALTSAVMDNLPRFAEVAIQIITMLVTSLISNLPQILSAAAKLAVAIGKGILQAAPQVVAALLTLIGQLIQYIASKVSAFLEKGKQLVSSIASGIVAKAGELIGEMASLIANVIAAIAAKAGEFLAKGKEIVNKVKQGISSTVGQLLAKGREIVQKVISGISSQISAARAKATELINSIKSAIQGAVGGFFSIGSSIVSGIIGGMGSMLGSVIAKAKEIIRGAKDAATQEAEVNSPSKLFAREVGMPISEGIAYGMDKGIGMVEESARNIINATESAFDNMSDIGSTINGAFNLRAEETPNAKIGDNITINVYPQKGQSETEIAAEVQRVLVRWDRQRKAAGIA